MKIYQPVAMGEDIAGNRARRYSRLVYPTLAGAGRGVDGFIARCQADSDIGVIEVEETDVIELILVGDINNLPEVV